MPQPGAPRPALHGEIAAGSGFGGPGTSTQTVAYFLWEQVWVFNKFGFGAAASVLLLIIFSVLIFFGISMLIRQRQAIEGRPA